MRKGKGSCSSSKEKARVVAYDEREKRMKGKMEEFAKQEQIKMLEGIRETLKGLWLMKYSDMCNDECPELHRKEIIEKLDQKIKEIKEEGL